MTARTPTILIALASVGLVHIGLVFASKWHRLDQKRQEIEARFQAIDTRLIMAREENDAIRQFVERLEKGGLTHRTASAEELTRTTKMAVTEIFPGSRVELLHDGRLLPAAARSAVLPVTLRMQLADNGLSSQLRRLEAIQPGLLISAMRAKPAERQAPLGNVIGLLQVEIDGFLIQLPRGGKP